VYDHDGIQIAPEEKRSQYIHLKVVVYEHFIMSHCCSWVSFFVVEEYLFTSDSTKI